MGYGRETINNVFTGEKKIPVVIDIETGNACSSVKGKYNKDTFTTRLVTSEAKMRIVGTLPEVQKKEVKHILNEESIINLTLIEEWKKTKTFLSESFLNHLPMDTLLQIQEHYQIKGYEN